MMSPQGTAFLYISDNLLEQVQPAHVGWLSVQDAWNFFDYKLDFLEGAARFELGTENWLGIYGMKGAFQLFETFGIQNIETRILELTNHLIKGFNDQKIAVVSALESRHRSGIVSVKPPSAEAAEQMRRVLRDNRIVASVREGLIRFSPHFYNTIDEMDQILDVLSTPTH